MYVCMSVRNGLTIKVYGFTHSLHTFWHMTLMMPLRWRGLGDDTRTSPEIEDGQLLNKRMKDKITVTGDELRVSAPAVYFAPDP